MPNNLRRNQLLRLSPIISGLMLYRFRWLTRSWGMESVNSTASVVMAWHLYNALKNEKKLNAAAWTEMDVLYDMFEPSGFHVGTSPPQEEYHMRYGYLVGVKPSFFHPKALARQAQIDAGPDRYKCECRFIQLRGAPVSDLFAPRYVQGTQKLDWMPQDIAEILSDSNWQTEGSLVSGNLSMQQLSREARIQAAKNRKRQRHLGNMQSKKLAADQLDESLAMALNAEAMDVSFPWLAVESHCWRLLQDVKSVSQKDLKGKVLVGESKTPLGVAGEMMFTVLAILTEIASDNMKPFERAAEVMNAFIERSDNTILGDVTVGLPVK